MKHFKLSSFILTLILSGFFNSPTFAQIKEHEIGLRMSGFNRFDFIYKKAKDEKRFNRYRLVAANLGFRSLNDINYFDFSFSLAVGREKRKAINDQLKFIYGFEPRLNFSSTFADDIGIYIVTALGLGYVLGFQYDISDDFYVNIETIPSLSAQFRSMTNEVPINAVFNSNNIALSFAYHFDKKKE